TRILKNVQKMKMFKFGGNRKRDSSLHSEWQEREMPGGRKALPYDIRERSLRRQRHGLLYAGLRLAQCHCGGCDESDDDPLLDRVADLHDMHVLALRQTKINRSRFFRWKRD